MKKIFILFVVLLVLCGGCSKKSSVKSCTYTEPNYSQIMKLYAIGDTINSIDLTITFENDYFKDIIANFVSLNTIDEFTKSQIRQTILDSLWLDSNVYEGLTVNIDIESTVKVHILADLTKASPEVLDKIDLNFTKENMSLKTAVKKLKKSGVICS